MFIDEQFKKKINIFDYLIKYDEKKSKIENKINSYIDSLSHNIITDDKLIHIIQKLINELLSLNPKQLIKTNKDYKSTQTEIKITTAFEFDIMKDYYETEIFDLKRNLHLRELEISELEITYSSLLNEKNKLSEDINMIQKECQMLRLENDKLRWENDILFLDYDEIKTKINNKIEYINELESRLDKSHKCDKLENINLMDRVFESEKRLFDVCKYLTPNEVYNFKNSSKTIYSLIISHTNISKNILYRVVSEKNKIINKIKDNLLEEYEEHGTRLENLAVEYVNNDSKGIKEYAGIILKALDFINNKVKSHKDSRNNKGLSNLVSGLFNSMSTASSSRTKGSFSTNDRSSFSMGSDYFIEFENDFKSASEIKNIVQSSVLKLLEGNDSDKFNSIMDELCYEYGELVYHSIEIIREFYEILSVKNNLFDWLKDLQKEMKIHENEINNLKITLKSKTILIDMINQEKFAFSHKLEKCEKELKITRQQNTQKQIINWSERYDDLSQEFEIYRSLIKLENDDLKYDLNKTIEERNNLMKELLNFRNLFNNINI